MKQGGMDRGRDLGGALGGISGRGGSGRGLQQEMVLKFDVEAVPFAG